jgi:hypothetical protein
LPRGHAEAPQISIFLRRHRRARLTGVIPSLGQLTFISNVYVRFF